MGKGMTVPCLLIFSSISLISAARKSNSLRLTLRPEPAAVRLGGIGYISLSTAAGLVGSAGGMINFFGFGWLGFSTP